MQDAVERFRREPDAGNTDGPFTLRSSVSEPATSAAVATAWRGRVVPDEVQELWRVARSARLFEDVDYGQWGLELLDPVASKRRTDEARAARPDEHRAEDIVIGRFIGDLELLVYAPSEPGSRRVLVALPLDPRAEWWGVAENLADFLVTYFDADGDKYWERPILSSTS